MTWTKYNNPNKKRRPRLKIDRTEADIMSGKQMLIDSNMGYKTVEKTYDEISDQLCGKPSRNI